MLFENAFGKRYLDWTALPLTADSLKKLRQYDRSKVAPVFVFHDGQSGDSRAVARFFANAFGLRFVAVRLPALLNTCLHDSDRKINQLFSRPENREAVLFIDKADALLTKDAVKPEKAAYLLARISAHQAPVFLASHMLPSADSSVSGMKPTLITLNMTADTTELCQLC